MFFQKIICKGKVVKKYLWTQSCLGTFFDIVKCNYHIFILFRSKNSFQNFYILCCVYLSVDKKKLFDTFEKKTKTTIHNIFLTNHMNFSSIITYLYEIFSYQLLQSSFYIAIPYIALCSIMSVIMEIIIYINLGEWIKMKTHRNPST